MTYVSLEEQLENLVFMYLAGWFVYGGGGEINPVQDFGLWNVP